MQPSSPAGGQPRLHLSSLRLLLIDLDGVIYRGRGALPAAAEFVAFLRRNNVAIRFITNNATLTPRAYAAKLGGMEIPVVEEEILTSAIATGQYLRERAPRGSSAFVIGEEGLEEAVVAAGLRLQSEQPEWVVVGLDRELTYDKLASAALAVENGAQFIGTNPDTSYPDERGLMPGAGAIQALISATTGVAPIVIGKPHPLMLRLAMTELGSNSSNTAMLGDRLDTDVQAAENAGIPSILVLTGVSSRHDLEQCSLEPALVVQDLPALIASWSASLPQPNLPNGA